MVFLFMLPLASVRAWAVSMLLMYCAQAMLSYTKYPLLPACPVLPACSGTLGSELHEGDTVTFISTLHGG